MNIIHKCLIFFFLITPAVLSGQHSGLEGIILEKYYVFNPEDFKDRDSAELPPEGSVTYRVYVDMEPGYSLQLVFGFKDNPLLIETSTSFYNHTSWGDNTGDRINENMIINSPVALDSWLTMGSASRKHVGIIKLSDPDGNNLEIKSLGDQDGMIEKHLTQVVAYEMDYSIVDGTGNANKLYATNSAWANLGGITGPDEENRVLIAQLTTDGELTMELNIQMSTPDCEVVQYVARNPVKEQIQSDLLFVKSN